MFNKRKAVSKPTYDTSGFGDALYDDDPQRPSKRFDRFDEPKHDTQARPRGPRGKFTIRDATNDTTDFGSLDGWDNDPLEGVRYDKNGDPVLELTETKTVVQDTDPLRDDYWYEPGEGAGRAAAEGLGEGDSLLVDAVQAAERGSGEGAGAASELAMLGEAGAIAGGGLALAVGAYELGNYIAGLKNGTITTEEQDMATRSQRNEFITEMQKTHADRRAKLEKVRQGIAKDIAQLRKGGLDVTMADLTVQPPKIPDSLTVTEYNTSKNSWIRDNPEAIMANYSGGYAYESNPAVYQFWAGRNKELNDYQALLQKSIDALEKSRQEMKYRQDRNVRAAQALEIPIDKTGKILWPSAADKDFALKDYELRYGGPINIPKPDSRQFLDELKKQSEKERAAVQETLDVLSGKTQMKNRRNEQMENDDMATASYYERLHKEDLAREAAAKKPPVVPPAPAPDPTPTPAAPVAPTPSAVPVAPPKPTPPPATDPASTTVNPDPIARPAEVAESAGGGSDAPMDDGAGEIWSLIDEMPTEHEKEEFMATGRFHYHDPALFRTSNAGLFAADMVRQRGGVLPTRPLLFRL